MSAALSEQSKQSYRRAWRHYTDFARDEELGQIFPVTIDNLSLFVTHLHQAEYAPATIISYVSAISFIHKLLGADDPGEAFATSLPPTSR